MDKTSTPAIAKAETMTQEEKIGQAIGKILKEANRRKVLEYGSFLEPLIGSSYEAFFTAQPLVVSMILANADRYNEETIRNFVESLQNVNNTLYEVATIQDILTDIQELLESLNTAMNNL